MPKPTRTKSARKPGIATPRASKMVKCACASCQCTVDIARGVRKGNLVFCNTACATRCTIEECLCEHDHCSV